MKYIETSKLSGMALDWAVAQVEGKALTIISKHWLTGKPYLCSEPMENDLPEWSPSTNFSQGGPLLEKYEVTVIKNGAEWWAGLDCQAGDGSAIYMEHSHVGSSYLIAACRTVVATKLGGFVDVPEDFLNQA